MMNWLIWLNLTLFIGHELDAIQQEEWQFFAQPFTVSDELAYRVFTLLHVPLLLWIFSVLMMDSFQIGFSLFMLAHAVIHTLLRTHRLLHFNTRFSMLFIYMPVPVAIVHLLLVGWG